MKIQRRYYVLSSHGEVGPVSLETIAEKLAASQLVATDIVRSGFGKNLGTVAALLDGAVQESDLTSPVDLTAPTPKPVKIPAATDRRRRGSDRLTQKAETSRRVPFIPLGGALVVALAVIAWFWLMPGASPPFASLADLTGADSAASAATLLVRLDRLADQPVSITLKLTGVADPLECTPAVNAVVIPAGQSSVSIRIGVPEHHAPPCPIRSVTVAIAADALAYRCNPDQRFTYTLGISPVLTGMTGVVAAYSTRWLVGDYTGPLVRIRRSTDAAEQDFFPDQTGWLSLDSHNTKAVRLGDWIRRDRGVVTCWYDQSGGTRHARSAWSGSEPWVVDEGKLIRLGPAPVLYFTGDSRLTHNKRIPCDFQSLALHTVFGEQSHKGYAGILAVIPSQNGQDFVAPDGLDINTNDGEIDARFESQNRHLDLIGAKPSVFAIRTWSSTLSDWSGWRNGGLSGNRFHLDNSNATNAGLLIGSRCVGDFLTSKNASIGNPLNGHIAELIMMSPNPGDDIRQKIERSQAEAFGIPLESSP